MLKKGSRSPPSPNESGWVQLHLYVGCAVLASLPAPEVEITLKHDWDGDSTVLTHGSFSVQQLGDLPVFLLSPKRTAGGTGKE